jgi:toxin CcdB
MTQFDVFTNPITRVRRPFPLVVVLQADLARTAGERMVAPLAPAPLPGGTGKVFPVVTFAGVEHVVFVPQMSSLAAVDLRNHRGQLSAYRSEILAAIDYLFFGV